MKFVDKIEEKLDKFLNIGEKEVGYVWVGEGENPFVDSRNN